MELRVGTGRTDGKVSSPALTGIHPDNKERRVTPKRNLFR
jgi:hypothetical protein